MRAGELDRKIVIETPAATPNAIGEPVVTWSEYATVWAQVRPLRGQEYFQAAQMNVEVDAVFRIRWLAGVLPTMRINYDGKLWDIQHLAEIGRRTGLDVMARVHQG